MIVFLIISVSKWKGHPCIVLLLATMTLGILGGLEGAKMIEVLLDGFSNTLKWIAIVGIFGAFIGKVLRETGGALRISNAAVKWVGKKTAMSHGDNRIFGFDSCIC